MVFVDTSAWFAYFLPIDAAHSKVRDCIASNSQPLVTTDYCVDETLTLLMARGEVRRALDAAAGAQRSARDICSQLAEAALAHSAGVREDDITVVVARRS